MSLRRLARGVTVRPYLEECSTLADPQIPRSASYANPHAGEPLGDYRARLIAERAEALERRQRELAEQVSIQNTPADRIRIWERLHEIALPRDPRHRLLQVIADATRLGLDQVLSEQQARASARSTPA